MLINTPENREVIQVALRTGPPTLMEENNG
jgi:hypothetical protein